MMNDQICIQEYLTGASSNGKLHFVKYEVYILLVPWEIQAHLGKVSQVRVTSLYLHWNVRLSSTSLLVVV